MENYIKEYSNRLVDLYRTSKGWVYSKHEKLLINGYYKLTGIEFLTVLFYGFLISVALIPLTGDWSPWLSLSYGLIPWTLVELLVYAKRELNK